MCAASTARRYRKPHRLHALACRDLPRSARAQDKNTWERWPSRLLTGKTVGILGVGLIAEYLAPICKLFGMTVIGISGSPRESKGFDAWSIATTC